MRTSSFAFDTLDVSSNHQEGGRKKASSVSLGGDLRSLLLSQSGAANRYSGNNHSNNAHVNHGNHHSNSHSVHPASSTASLSGMSILLLPVTPRGVDLSRGSSIGLQGGICGGKNSVTGINQHNLGGAVDEAILRRDAYKRVDCVVLSLCAVGDCLSMIGTCTALLGVWRKVLERNFRIYARVFNEELRTTKTLIILSTISGVFALISGIIKLRTHCPTNRKIYHIIFISMLITSFLFSLVSIALWADLIAHGNVRLKSHLKLFQKHPKLQNALLDMHMKPISKSSKSPHSQQKITRENSPLLPFKPPTPSPHQSVSFGWAYWVFVASSLFQFMANVCHLIRRDCRQNRYGSSYDDGSSSQSDDDNDDSGKGGCGDDDDTSPSVTKDRKQRRSLSAASFSAVVGVGSRFSATRFNKRAF